MVLIHALQAAGTTGRTPESVTGPINEDHIMFYLPPVQEPCVKYLTPAVKSELETVFKRPGLADAIMLKALHKERGERIERIRRARERRADFLRALVELAEDGKIAVIESGRDCDCVEYDGRVHLIDATVAAFNELDDSIGEWADGPYHLSLERPSAAERVEYTARDLVLEAFEDGHPHSIVSRFA